MNTHPQVSEIEVSLFGPGFGESAVIHFGQNTWMVVDSCINPSTKEVLPLEYLKKIGVNVKQHVELIVATHWHDDHIRGISKIVDECENARFFCSRALLEKEFLAMTDAYDPVKFQGDSGIQEMINIIRTLKDRSSIPNGTSADHLLFRKQMSFANAGLVTVVHSLSPSQRDEFEARRILRKLIPDVKAIQRKVTSIAPNDSSVVLHLSIGPISMLLGADLEQRSDAQSGWSAIISSTTRPNNRSLVFKIPHHGSSTGQNPDVWQDMLVHNPFSLITPFINGRNILPTKDELEWIESKTNRIYLTAKPRRRAPIRRQNVVQKQIKRVSRNLRPVFSSVGQIRLRMSIDSGLHKVDLFNGAYQV